MISSSPQQRAQNFSSMVLAEHVESHESPVPNLREDQHDAPNEFRSAFNSSAYALPQYTGGGGQMERERKQCYSQCTPSQNAPRAQSRSYAGISFLPLQSYGSLRAPDSCRRATEDPLSATRWLPVGGDVSDGRGCDTRLSSDLMHPSNDVYASVQSGCGLSPEACALLVGAVGTPVRKDSERGVRSGYSSWK